VRADRAGKGLADLSLRVPTNLVAGAGFVCSMTPIGLRRRRKARDECPVAHAGIAAA
jgi:hypothetical protein